MLFSAFSKKRWRVTWTLYSKFYHKINSFSWAKIAFFIFFIDSKKDLLFFYFKISKQKIIK